MDRMGIELLLMGSGDRSVSRYHCSPSVNDLVLDTEITIYMDRVEIDRKKQ